MLKNKKFNTGLKTKNKIGMMLIILAMVAFMIQPIAQKTLGQNRPGAMPEALIEKRIFNYLSAFKTPDDIKELEKFLVKKENEWDLAKKEVAFFALKREEKNIGDFDPGQSSILENQPENPTVASLLQLIEKEIALTEIKYQLNNANQELAPLLASLSETNPAALQEANNDLKAILISLESIPLETIELNEEALGWLLGLKQYVKREIDLTEKIYRYFFALEKIRQDFAKLSASDFSFQSALIDFKHQAESALFLKLNEKLIQPGEASAPLNKIEKALFNELNLVRSLDASNIVNEVNTKKAILETLSEKDHSDLLNYSGETTTLITEVINGLSLNAFQPEAHLESFKKLYDFYLEKQAGAELNDLIINIEKFSFYAPINTPEVTATEEFEVQTTPLEERVLEETPLKEDVVETETINETPEAETQEIIEEVMTPEIPEETLLEEVIEEEVIIESAIVEEVAEVETAPEVQQANVEVDTEINTENIDESEAVTEEIPLEKNETTPEKVIPSVLLLSIEDPLSALKSMAVDEALINEYEAKALENKYAEVTKKFISEFNFKKNSLDEFNRSSESFSENELDEWMSFLNQALIEMNRPLPGGFEGIIGALRFDEKNCKNTEAIDGKTSKPFCIKEDSDSSIRNVLDEKEVKRESVTSKRYKNESFEIQFSKDTHPIIDIEFETSKQELKSMRLKKISEENPSAMDIVALSEIEAKDALFTPIKINDEEEKTVVFSSEDFRQNDIYVYRYNKNSIRPNSLKNYTILNFGEGAETIRYAFENSILNKRADGKIDGYYAKGIHTEKKRAQETLNQILVSGNTAPDFTIDAPFALNKNNELIDISYEVSGESMNELRIDVQAEQDSYPIVVDPTITFQAPGTSSASHTIGGTVEYGQFGYSAITLDLNTDGKKDLVVSARDEESGSGKIYIFLNTTTLPATTASADWVITGETSSYFGEEMLAADINQDGRKDLIVSSKTYSENTGRVYVFFADGSMGTAPCTTGCSASNADVIITGEATYTEFGYAMTAADLNGNGYEDLIISAPSDYTTNSGKVYVFYTDGNVGTTTCTTGCLAADSDLVIAGSFNYHFGSSIAVGDFNQNGKMDLAVGGKDYNYGYGRVYLIYNDGGWPTLASSADVIMTGVGSVDNLGAGLTAADFNDDGKTDLAATAYGYTSSSGRVYIFYNDGTYPTNPNSADVIISGTGSGEAFGWTIISGDLNNDDKTDLVVSSYDGYTGKMHIFLNDGSFPSNASLADSIIEGAGLDNYLGYFTSWIGDINRDGVKDLITSSVGANTYAGELYIFYGQGGVAPERNSVSGESVNSNFGIRSAIGDFNADGKEDIAVSAPAYGSNQGRVYLFYGKNSVPTSATEADVTITGESGTSLFGNDIIAADINHDGIKDLVVTAPDYGSNGEGRVYGFLSDGTWPSNASGADTIITGATNEGVGLNVTSGDLNADGRDDLAVSLDRSGVPLDNQVVIFYQPTSGYSASLSPSGADATITGSSSSIFGAKLLTIDINRDGKRDLVASDYGMNSYTGALYFFYNDGSYPTSASSADMTIAGESSNNRFGYAMSSGDFNADSVDDLLVGAYEYNGDSTGRAYVIFTDSDFPAAGNGADIILNGDEAGISLGANVYGGDINNDGFDDIAVAAVTYGSPTEYGRIYIHYQPRTGFNSTLNPADANIKITGASAGRLGSSLAMADITQDGQKDLIIGKPYENTNTGRLFIMPGESSHSWQTQIGYPPLMDVQTGFVNEIRGSISDAYFGYTYAVGDFDRNGLNDVAVGAYSPATTGRVYIFLNDGDIPIYDSGADVVITGENVGDDFGKVLASGHVSTLRDTYDDLLIGAPGYGSDMGQVYLFNGRSTWNSTYTYADANSTFSGLSNGDEFGASILANVDLSTTPDPWTDIAIGAPGTNSNDGAVYIFENDGLYGSADITIAGDSTGDGRFGSSLAASDLSITSDVRKDLLIGAPAYSSNTGRAYIIYNDGAYPANATGADYTLNGNASGDYFGYSVATGFISETRDARSDLAIGAYGTSTSAGAVHIYNNDGAAYTTADKTITGNATSEFGKSLHIADVTRDGRDDLMIGAPSEDSGSGRIYLMNGDSSLPTAANSADRIFYGQNGAGLGTNLCAADINRDGWMGILGGAPNYGNNKGKVYLYTLNAESIDGETGSQLGTASAVADINNDGIPDLIIGAPAYSSSQGRVYIYYGRPHGRIITEADITITGTTSGDRFGTEIVTTDMDGDGKADIIIGADQNGTGEGKVYIFYSDGSIATAASSADVIITGESSSLFGGKKSIATTDLNKDGNNDLIIGATNYGSEAGRIYLFYNDGSFGTVACTTGCLAANADATIAGASTSRLGMVETGDMDNDGTNDIIATAYRSPSDYTGAVHIFYNDGSLPTSTASADVTISGENTGDWFGAGLKVSDVNGDGKEDVVAAASSYNSNQGRVYVFYNDGSYATSAGSADVIITGDTSSRIGHLNSLQVVDINNDGKNDLLIGGYLHDSSTGRLYGFYQSQTGFSTTLSASDADLTLDGESTNSSFGTNITYGDLNQDAQNDLIIGATGSDGMTYIYYGANGLLPTPPTVTISSLSGDTAAPYWDLTDDSSTYITLASETADECRWSTSEITDANYSAATACADPVSGEITCNLGNLTDGLTYTRYFRCTYSGSNISTGTDTEITFGVDVTQPSTPVISSTTHVNESTYYTYGYADFSWSDTDTGPSDATFYYCVDTTDTCDPSTQDADRIVANESLSLGTNYIRVKNCDLFTCSNIASYTALDDTSIPADPTISCSGFTSGVWTDATSTTCTWDDTTGPSTGTFNYCTDTLNTCTPDTSDPDRSVDLSSLPSGHTYIRVQSTDVAGSSNVVSFDLAVNDQPELTSVAADDGTPSNTIEPDDVITFRATIADADSNVSMVVCTDGASFNGAADPCNGGTVICSSLDQTPGTLNCQADASYSSIPAAHGNYDYEIFVYDDRDVEALYTAPSAQVWQITDVAPVISSVTPASHPFALTAGTTTPYGWTATITDANGDLDVTSASGIAYDSAVTTNACSSSEQNCYIAASCTLGSQSSAGSGKLTTGSDSSLTATCSVSMQFNTNASANWVAEVTTIDGTGNTTQASDPSEVLPLLALDVRNESDQTTGSFAFGNLTPGQNSGTLSLPIYIANVGNMPLDTNYYSSEICNNWVTPYSDCAGNTINVGEQEWSLSASTPYGSGTDAELQLNQSCINTNIAVRTPSTSSASNTPVYFGINIPSGTAAGTYTWQNVFTSASEASCP